MNFGRGPLFPQGSEIPIDTFHLGHRNSFPQEQETPMKGINQQETQNYTAAVPNFNRMPEISRNGGLLESFTYGNGGMSYAADPGTQAFNVNVGRWDSSWSELLGMIRTPPTAFENVRMATRSTDLTNNHAVSQSYFGGGRVGMQQLQSTSLMQPNLFSPMESNQQSFNSTPQHTIQDEFPIHYWPHDNMNSLPRTDEEFCSTITNSCQFAPGTPQQAKKSECQPNFMMGNSITDNSLSKKETKQNMSVDPRRQEAKRSCFPELSEILADSSPVAIETPIKETTEYTGESNYIDLNKTPPLIPPKRKKHRPKVVIEDKPRRTKKPVDKKNAGTEEKKVAKRKYVRKNGPNNASPPNREAIKESRNASTEPRSESCRRSLNFEMGTETKADNEKKPVNQKMAKHNVSENILPIDTEETGHNNASGANRLNSTTHMDLWDKLMVASKEYFPRPPETISQMWTHKTPTHTPQLPCKPSMMKDQRTKQPQTTNTGEEALGQGHGLLEYHCIPTNEPLNAGDNNSVFQERTDQCNLARIREQILQRAAHKMQQTMSCTPSRGSKREHCLTMTSIQQHSVNGMGSLQLGHVILDTNKNANDSNIFGNINPRVFKKTRVETGDYLKTTSGIQACEHAESGVGPFSRSNGHLVLPNHFQQVKSQSPNSNSPNVYTGNRCLTSKPIDNYASAVSNNQKHHLSLEMLQQLHKRTWNRGNMSIQSGDKISSIIAEPNSDMQHWTVMNAAQIFNGQGSEISRPNTNYLAKIQNGETTTLQSELHNTGAEQKQTKVVPDTEILHQLGLLNLSATDSEKLRHEQGALVVYRGNNALVPYESTDHLRRRKPRPKVHLDPETNRIWKLLMGKEDSIHDKEMDEDKARWWEEERNVFRGRADSFIARMHLVQGDRRFSRWKGSVVDSVIGVFLTQNVSDHLSSSAFMSLAAKFPVQLKTKVDACHSEERSMVVEKLEISNIKEDDRIGWKKVMTKQTIYRSPSEPFHHRSNFSLAERHPSKIDENTLVVEEVISSQNSTGSSRNQDAGGMQSCLARSTECSGATNGSETVSAYKSIFTTLQEIENFMFSDFPSHGTKTSLSKEIPTSGHELESNGNFMDSLQSDGCVSEETFPFDLNSPYIHVSDVPLTYCQVPVSGSSQSFAIQGSGMPAKECNTLSSSFLGFGGLEDLASTATRSAEVGESRSTCQQTRQTWGKETPTCADELSTRMLEGLQRYQQQSSDNETTNTSQCASISTTHRLINALQTTSHFNNFVQTVDSERTVSEADRKNIRNQTLDSNPTEQVSSLNIVSSTKEASALNENGRKMDKDTVNAFDWDSLRRQVQIDGKRDERSKNAADSLDYEALRNADKNEISKVIKERGMNNMLAARIKEFLNRLVEEHGSIDLEWLRDIPPDKAKEYLLSINGLGLKSVECVRLLTLHHLAFPVDTNVGRIAVRLGWVPLQPLPESLQLHLLEMYPVLDTVQKYLWPRLCKLDQQTLYELHYQLITFGKVFCTKSKPNCNACPMRGECRHFASAFASARLALPEPDDKSIVTAAAPIRANATPLLAANPISVQQLESIPSGKVSFEPGYRWCEPIVEEPTTPEPESPEISEMDIEDVYDDPEEIPTIKLNAEAFTLNIQNFMQENMELQEGDLSKALVAITPDTASIPTSKLKNISRLRTEHQVYELPDTHPLLKDLDKREPDDPSPYLLAIWTPGETTNSIQPPQVSCGCMESGKLCSETTCFSCNSIREANPHIVRGTILIPCRTAMQGSFPLNGTYFQVNEMFADHDSSLNPIAVPRAWIWNLPRRTVYFGTSVTTILKGMTTEEIQFCFWRGFVCVRGFDRKTRAPRPLIARLHFPASKTEKAKTETKGKRRSRREQGTYE